MKLDLAPEVDVEVRSYGQVRIGEGIAYGISSRKKSA
jgi:hypothetical protein